MLSHLSPPFLSANVTEHKHIFSVLFLSPLTRLNCTSQKFTGTLPNPTWQPNREYEHVRLIHESRDERIYKRNTLVQKEYKWFNCEAVNKALADAVSLAAEIQGNNSFVTEVKCILNPDYGKPRILLFLRNKGFALLPDIHERRRHMTHYSELQLVDYLSSLANILHAAHKRVTSKQKLGHGSLRPTCIYLSNIGENQSGIDGFGGLGSAGRLCSSACIRTESSHIAYGSPVASL